MTHYTGQTIYSLALQTADASKVTPFTYSSGVMLMFVDILVFEYQFTVTDVVGMAVVIFALVVGFILSKKK